MFALAVQESGETPMRRRFQEECGQNLNGAPLGSWYNDPLRCRPDVVLKDPISNLYIIIERKTSRLSDPLHKMWRFSACTPLTNKLRNHRLPSQGLALVVSGVLR
jgi:hypothetical protein